MSQLLRIEEDDLAALESILPKIASRLTPQMDNTTRVHLRRVQSILSNVRWGYGPPKNVTVIPVDTDQDNL